jgi:glycosyltransferase involved in cell wall biosynthesis
MREQARILNQEHAARGVGRRIPVTVVEREEREYAAAQHIVVESEYARRTHIERGVKADKVKVVTPGVDLDCFAPRPARRERFRVLMISPNLRKGLHSMLLAWEQARLPGAELWLEGRLDQAAARLVEGCHPGLGIRRVPRFSGPAELSRLTGTCSVFAVPTLFDGGPRVLLEAMACGLPVICSERSIGPDLLSGEGSAGFVVPAGDVDALAEVLRWCHKHQNELPVMGQRAREIVERRCQWSGYIGRLRSAISEFGL